MHCKYCGFGNGDDDHRCLRCGRRIGIAFAAPVGYSGANALAIVPAFEANDSQEIEPLLAQPALFSTTVSSPGQNVIPFDRFQRQTTGRLAAQPAAPPHAPTKKIAVKAHATSTSHSAVQEPFDFTPTASPAQRTLKTHVPAEIYCEQPVATPTHRFIASSMDAAVIVLGFGLFVVAAEVTGANFGQGKFFPIVMAASFALISMFYGLIWAIAARETAGMRWTDLQLITFDGFPVDSRSRASRVASTWLSFCSGGLGLLWAVADEENLTWHDHISRTFPTIRESSGNFVKQRR